MPTIKGIPGPYRLFFFSFDCNEPCHVHVQREDRVCKFWLQPVAMATNHGFGARELRDIFRIVREHREVILEAWDEHCSGIRRSSSR